MTAKRTTPWLGPAGKNAIDFPCSYSFRAYYEETFYGRYLPSIEPPQHTTGELNERIIKLEEPTMKSGLTYKELQQIKGEITYLMNKLNTHLDASKGKKKGLVVE